MNFGTKNLYDSYHFEFGDNIPVTICLTLNSGQQIRYNLCRATRLGCKQTLTTRKSFWSRDNNSVTIRHMLSSGTNNALQFISFSFRGQAIRYNSLQSEFGDKTSDTILIIVSSVQQIRCNLCRATRSGVNKYVTSTRLILISGKPSCCKSWQFEFGDNESVTVLAKLSLGTNQTVTINTINTFLSLFVKYQLELISL